MYKIKLKYFKALVSLFKIATPRIISNNNSVCYFILEDWFVGYKNSFRMKKKIFENFCTAV